MPEITLLAHNIRSTYNIGAIMRTAEGFGVRQIIFSGYTPYPDLRLADPQSNDTRLPHITEKLTAQIHKTALGAETMLPFTYVADIREWLLKNANDEHLPVIALEQSASSVALDTFRPPDRFALLLGEEVYGIEPDILARCDHIVEIPMWGAKESFNVSVAAGIALYGLCFPR